MQSNTMSIEEQCHPPPPTPTHSPQSSLPMPPHLSPTPHALLVFTRCKVTVHSFSFRTSMIFLGSLQAALSGSGFFLA